VNQLTLAAIAGMLGWSLTGVYTRMMIARQRLETPNERSMHTTPVPVGGGIAIVAILLTLWPLWCGTLSRLQICIFGGLAILAALSWLDDRRSLSPVVRLMAHVMVVAFCLIQMPTDARIMPQLPLALERLFLGASWVWFMNLFNFMDGIDGIAASETIAIALGYIAVTAGAQSELAPIALILAAATTGFLMWNWHPAKVFMGDVGSVAIGFVLGWLLIELAIRRHFSAALILPLYFAADATLTLLKRTLRGSRPWQAHREHFYQRAVLGGITHSGVVLRVIAINVILLILALLAEQRPVTASVAAALVVAGLLAHLDWISHQRASPAS
jgi:UDP-N-acetylmuramyl pentapeptide phosphotransferase/UDP-N-acetylglucosamine-1-phosphate transferase